MTISHFTWTERLFDSLSKAFLFLLLDVDTHVFHVELCFLHRCFEIQHKQHRNHFRGNINLRYRNNTGFSCRSEGMKCSALGSRGQKSYPCHAPTRDVFLCNSLY